MKICQNNIIQKIVYGLIIFLGLLASSKLSSLQFTVKNINSVENMYIDAGIIDILLRDIKFLRIITFIMSMIAIVAYYTFISSINKKYSTKR